MKLPLGTYRSIRIEQLQSGVYAITFPNGLTVLIRCDPVAITTGLQSLTVWEDDNGESFISLHLIRHQNITVKYRVILSREDLVEELI